MCHNVSRKHIEAAATSTMLSGDASQRINTLRFPLIVGIVFIHAYATTAEFHGVKVGTIHNSFIADFVRNFISNGVARTAVPLLFLIAGYLFFAGFIITTKNYIKKLNSRVSTLFIPFLFWNITTLVALAVIQALPVSQVYLSGKHDPISSLSVFEYFRVVFGIGRNPIAYHFWFIRDLMLLVLFVPIIYLLNKKLISLFLPLLFACWFFCIWPVSAPRAEATFFFSLGSYLGHTKKNLFFLDKYGSVITVAYAAVVITNVTYNHADLYGHLHKIGIILGMPAVLYVSRLALNTHKLKQLIMSLGTTSFFVYAAHEPLLTAARKAAYRCFQPQSTYLTLALYFIIPSMIIAFLVVTYRILKRLCPVFTAIITGGR